MLKTILAVLVGRQSLFAKKFSTFGSLCSGFKRYDSQKDLIRQNTPSIDELTPKDDITLPYGKFGILSIPTMETHSQEFDGIKYTDLPIVHIKSSSNNTIILASDAAGKPLSIQSGGKVGFRNAKKGTNVAAQAAAIALAQEVLRKNIRTVRVCLKGLGVGKLPALKALELSGLRIVSITDTTPLAFNGNRPKKVRRL